MSGNSTKVVVLAGGFGGARMAHGFELLGEQVELSVIVNTADDLELHGLMVSPDLDTVMYTLAGLANDATGWGVRDETWSAAEMLARYGAPTWFRLGDRDLATHIFRTAALRAGKSLTEVTAEMCGRLGIRATLLPMTDDLVRTKIRTAEGWLDFQDYFVSRSHADPVIEVVFEGIQDAAPTAQVMDAIKEADLLVIAPSNPFVSVGPILAVPEILGALLMASAPVVAISPIIGGAAVRGPAADMITGLAHLPATAAGIATYYSATYPDLIDVLAIHNSDTADADGVAAAGLRPLVTNTLIGAADDRQRLAQELLTTIAG